MIEYCNRVFEVSNGKKQIKDFPNTSWICSCAAHSMNRFVRALKKINKNDDVHHFACYCFSLLLNSTDLNIMSRYFRLICLVF